MKKISLLLVLPFILSPITNVVSAEETSDITISEDIATKFVDSFKEKFQMSTDLTFKYDAYLPPLTIIDQFDADNRVNVITYNNYVLQEIYVAKDVSGYAKEQFLTVSNTVSSRYITNDQGDYISFANNYGSPFKSLSLLSADQVNSYFDIEKDLFNYRLKANKLGYGILSNALLNFYTDYDYFIWDTSVNESIENLEFSISSDGSPLSLSFDKIKKDIFGAIKENYDVRLSVINEVSTLQPVHSPMGEEKALEFDAKMASFQALLDEGNFTQTITFSSDAFVAPFSYSNCYQLKDNPDFIEGMLCTYPLEEVEQGETYVGVLNEGTSSSPNFATYGFSPDSSYFDNITTTTFTDRTTLVPRMGDISSGFFTYSSYFDNYTFDFQDFIYGDSEFLGTLLVSLFGMTDAFVQYLGFYLDDYSYNFSKLVIGFDEFDYPYGTLTYIRGNVEIESSFKFSNIGTTDLETNPDLAKVIDFIKNKVL